MERQQDNPRRLALNILMRVFGHQSYADILLNEYLPTLKKPYRALVTELVYGVLRWQIKIDWIIERFSDIPLEKIDNPLLCALRLGIYQLYFLRGIPPHACISETVELVKPYGKGRAGFVNAVLRAAQRSRHSVPFPSIKKEPVRYVSVIFSHPQWLVERWLNRYGLKQTIELCRTNLTPPPTVLRTNSLVITRETLIEELSKEGIKAAATTYSPHGIVVLDRYRGRVNPRDRRYYIQDEASQLIAPILSPRAGETILDACSAPGGKTTHIAQLMENRGLIVAMDNQPARLKRVDALARRLGITIIESLVADAKTFSPQYGLKGVESVAAYSDGFDAILVDAPCTGLGTLRRTPDIKIRRTPDDIRLSATGQRSLLSNLAGLVRPNGRLVYSVCSLEPEETDHIVQWFLLERTDFYLEDVAPFLPPACKPLITHEGFLKTHPAQVELDGFFAARFRRRARS